MEWPETSSQSGLAKSARPNLQRPCRMKGARGRLSETPVGGSAVAATDERQTAMGPWLSLTTAHPGTTASSQPAKQAV